MSSYIRLDKKERELRAKIVARLNAEVPVAASDFSLIAQPIVDIFKGCPSSVWWAIDNAIGNAEKIGINAPHLVRQVRNSPAWGPKLFAGLRP